MAFKLDCPITTCDFVTTEVRTIEVALQLLKLHTIEHESTVTASASTASASASASSTPRGPKLERPKTKLNSSPEEWNAFLRRWEAYRKGSNISDACAPGQLLECTSQELGDIVLRAHPDFTSKDITVATTLLRSLAVVPIALGVLRSELDSMVQDPDEPFRTFAAKVQGKAETCEFTTKYNGTCDTCYEEYTGTTYYTDERLRDVLLNGIADLDIRREALSVNDIQQRSIREIIGFVESREIARNANPVVGVTAVSAYRRNQKRPPPQPQHTQRSSSPSPADKTKTSSCADCGVTFLVFTKRARGGWNKNPHTRCQPCWKKAFDSAQHNTIESHDDTFGQLSSVSGSHNAVTLSHQIFTKGEWRRARLTAHPRAKLNIVPENNQSAPIAVDGVADSGAQSNVWSLAE